MISMVPLRTPQDVITAAGIAHLAEVGTPLPNTDLRIGSVDVALPDLDGLSENLAPWQRGEQVLPCNLHASRRREIEGFEA
jgi:hypothetical protein